MTKEPTHEGRLDDIRGEIMMAIKKRFLQITGKDYYRPLCIDEPSVMDTAAGVSGTVNYLHLQNIYLDDSGKMCGDFVNMDHPDGNDFIFGKEIDGLFVEDLVRILNKMYEMEADEEEPECGMKSGNNDRFTFPILKSYVKSFLHSRNV